MSGKTKGFHRWMALFLCVVMFASMLPAGSVFADDGQTVVLGIADDDLDTPEEAGEGDVGAEPAAEEPSEAEPEVPESPEEALPVSSDGEEEAEVPESSEEAEEPAEPDEEDDLLDDLDSLELDDASEDPAEVNHVTVFSDVRFEVVRDGTALKIIWEPLAMDEGGTVPKYQIYRLERDSDDVTAWEEETVWSLYKLKVVTANVNASELSWRDATVKNAHAYLYLIQCLDAKGNPLGETTDCVCFGYDADGTSLTATPITNNDLATKSAVALAGTLSPFTFYTYSKPAMKSAVMTENGIQLTWSSVGTLSGAVYVVRVWSDLNSDGVASEDEWLVAGTTTSTTYLHKNVISGEEYVFSVRVRSTNGVTWMSPSCDNNLTLDPTTNYKTFVDPNLIKITYIGKVSLLSVENKFVSGVGKNKIRLTWVPLNGAADYTIERRERTATTVGQWQILENARGGVVTIGSTLMGPDGVTPLCGYDTDGNLYFDDYEVVSGFLYDYRIRAMVDNPDYNPADPYSPMYIIAGTADDGKSIHYYDTPILKQDDVEMSDEGVTIWWQAVRGVHVYHILRRVVDPSVISPADPMTEIYTWKVIATVTREADTGKLSYTDTSAAAGVKELTAGQVYYYSVVCRDSNNTYDLSPYDEIGVAANYTKTPVLIGTEPADTGIKVKWYLVDGTQTYYVFRRVAGTQTWKRLEPYETFTPGYDPLGAEDNNIGFKIDDTVVPGTTYEYTVRVVDLTDNKYISSYDKTGVSGMWYPKPVMVTDPFITKSVTGGIRVVWEMVEGAPGYRVFRRVSGLTEPWIWIADVEATGGTCMYIDSSVDLNEGVAYEYTVCVLSKTGAEASVKADPPATVTYYPTPFLLNLESQKNALLLTWEKISGCEYYLVYRKTINSDWQLINYIPSTGFNETYVNPYAYPDNTTIMRYADEANTIVQYRDEDVISGTKYWYTVACWDGASVDPYGIPVDLSGYDPIGITKSWFGDLGLFNIKITIERLSTGAKVSWTTVDNAASNFAGVVKKYVVERREANSEWTVLGSVLASSAKNGIISYVDKTASNLGTYWYRVRCLSADGDDLGYLEAQSITFYAAPKLLSISLTQEVLASELPGFIELKWSDVDGAQGYNIYRKKGNATVWEKYLTVAAGTATLLKDDGYFGANPEKLQSGTKYTYTVAVADMLTGLDVSDRNATGLSIVFYDTPQLLSVVPGAKGNTVQWRTVKGAAGYRIYRRMIADPTDPTSAHSNWKQIATVKGYAKQTYLDTTVSASGFYQYYVCAYNGSITSGHLYDDTDLIPVATAAYVPAPVITSIENRNPGGSYYQEITWGVVPGATSYEIWGKNDTLKDKDYFLLDTVTTNTAVIDASVWLAANPSLPGTFDMYNSSTPYKFTYRVRAIVSTGQKSDYSAAMTMPYYPAVEVLSATSPSNAGNQIVWKKMPGINTYRIYRQLNNDGLWKVIAKSVSGYSYTDRYTKANDISCRDATYKVVGLLNGKEVTSPQDSMEQNAFFMLQPALVSAKVVHDDDGSAHNGEIQVTWKLVGDPYDSSVEYTLVRRKSTEKWDAAVDIPTGLNNTDAENGIMTYFDSVSENGVTFVYSVKAVHTTDESTYNKTGVKTLWYDTPTVVVTSVYNAAGDFVRSEIDITKPAGAKRVAVYYRDPYAITAVDGGWKLLGYTTGTLYKNVPTRSKQVLTIYEYCAAVANGSTIVSGMSAPDSDP